MLYHLLGYRAFIDLFFFQNFSLLPIRAPLSATYFCTCCVFFFVNATGSLNETTTKKYANYIILQSEFRLSIAVPWRSLNPSGSHAQSRTPIHAPTTASCSLPAKHLRRALLDTPSAPALSHSLRPGVRRLHRGIQTGGWMQVG